MNKTASSATQSANKVVSMYLSQINTLGIQFKRRNVKGSRDCALKTLNLLRSVISSIKIPPLPSSSEDNLIIRPSTSAAENESPGEPSEISSTPCSSIAQTKDSEVIISDSQYTIIFLAHIVGKIGNLLIKSAQPIELAIGNVIRRVLHLIREEAFNFGVTGDVDPSLQSGSVSTGQAEPSVPTRHGSLLRSSSSSSLDSGILSVLSPSASPTTLNALEPISTPAYPGTVSNHPVETSPSKSTSPTQHSSASSSSSNQVFHFMKPIVIQSINELIDEVETGNSHIANQAVDHIHSNEIIMTTGHSKTVEEFLIAAHRKRKFQVILAEASPSYSGQSMAIELSKAGIETTVISDSCVYAVMSRVNKVILGTHAILANGGLIAGCGTHMMAAAAKYHHIPVVVCSGLYKLSVLQPYDLDMFNLCVSPDSVLKFEEGELVSKCNVLNPYFDYISPDLISLFVTNQGGHAPSYIYRLLSENYDPKDYRLKT